MKKLTMVILVALTACVMFACTGSSQTQKTESERDPNAVISPTSLSDVKFMTGSWEVLMNSSEQIVYNTGSSIITFGFANLAVTSEDLTRSMLANTQFANVPLEFIDGIEEIETNNISGYKQTMRVGDFEAELFSFENTDKRYCLIVVYTNSENIAEARAAVDQVFSSMTVEKPIVDESVEIPADDNSAA